MSIATSEAKTIPDTKTDEQSLDWTSAKAIFLTWAPLSHSRRSQLIAARLGIPLVTIHALKHRRKLAPLRYAIQAVQTLITLARLRPRIIFVQNPPIFAALFAYLYCLVSGAKFIIDSHTDALFLETWKWLLPLHRYLSKRAISTVVTNEYLQDMIKSWDAHSIVIRDVPSEFPAGRSRTLDYAFNVVMVSSFASDEPMEEVIAAASSLPEVGFYITGNPKWGNKRLPSQLADNIHLTGFLSEEDYYALLRAADAVMALTTIDHTMQRGACEAVWLGKPIITSHWPLLQDFFHKGTLFVDNTAESIRQAVLDMQRKHPHLLDEVKKLQTERQELWQRWMGELQNRIREAEKSV